MRKNSQGAATGRRAAPLMRTETGTYNRYDGVPMWKGSARSGVSQNQFHKQEKRSPSSILSALCAGPTPSAHREEQCYHVGGMPGFDLSVWLAVLRRPQRICSSLSASLPAENISSSFCFHRPPGSMDP